MSANTVKHDPLDDLPDPPLDSSPVRSNNTPFSVGESRSSVSGGMVHNVLDSADSHDLDFLVVDANVAAATYGSMDLTSMSSVPLSDQIPEGSPEHRPGHRKQLSTIPSESGDPQAHADLDEGDLSGHHRRTVSSGGVGQQLNSVVTTRGMPLATMEGDTEVGSPSSPTEDYMQELMASSTSAMQVPMRVLIKDPVKVESSRIGMRSTYFTYQVVTETGVSGQSSQKTLEVRRRFNDFVALHKVLKQHFRGYFIPPLPDKGFVDSKFSREGFLRVRQVDLQAYMRSIVQHPALRTSEAVRIFTTAEGELSSHSRWQQLSQSPPGALEGLKGAIMGDSAPSPAPSGSLASVRPGIAVRFKHIIQRKVEVSEEEIHLRQAKERFRELQQHLLVACNAARVMVQHMECLSEDFGHLGRAMSMMARFEEQSGQKEGQYTEMGQAASARAVELQKTGYANGGQQTLWRQYAMRTAASLVFLHDSYILVPEAIAALEEREAALHVVNMVEEELAAAQMNYGRAEEKGVVGATPVLAKRMQALATSVTALQDKLQLAKEQYETLKSRNQAELVRLNLERASDFKHRLRRYAQVQAEMGAAFAELWSNVAETDPS